MECNVGGADRTVRIIAAVVLLAAAVFADVGTGWRMLLALLGLIAAVTALVRYCPLNRMIGLNTCKQSPTSLTR